MRGLHVSYIFGCSVKLPDLCLPLRLRVAERAQEKTPLRYMLSTEQMLENDYPIPSYIAEVFEKPDGWVETPQIVDETPPAKRMVLAVDCEMVRRHPLMYRVLSQIFSALRKMGNNSQECV